MLAPIVIRTGRLVLAPVGPSDLADLTALKTDARAFASMLGGVRTPQRAAEELAEDMAFWAAHGVGIFTVRERDGPGFVGMTGFHERPDGRGIGLRFSIWPALQGHGLAREAAGAALMFGHDRGLRRVVAVTREDNFGSRRVLGAIGMHEEANFVRDGHAMLVYASERTRAEGQSNSIRA